MSLRTLVEKKIDNPEVFKNQLLDWSQQYREMVFLDSNNYHQKQSSFDCVLAVDAFTSIKTDYHNAFEDLKQYQQQTKDWLFGYLSYDVKNDVDKSQYKSEGNLQAGAFAGFSGGKNYANQGEDDDREGISNSQVLFYFVGFGIVGTATSKFFEVIA
jgi:para-aminobenzoate synthetase component 1